MCQEFTDQNDIGQFAGLVMITYEKRTKQNLGITLKKQEVEWCELCVVFCVKKACNNHKICILLYKEVLK